MWQAIQYVTTPLTLLAFIAAVIAFLFQVRASKLKSLIDSAPADSRYTLIEGVLRDFKVIDTGNLTKKQKYEIVLRSLDDRGRRLKLLGYFSTVIFFLLCVMLVLLAVLPPSGSPVPVANIVYEPVNAYREIKVQKPVSWYLVNDGESPMFSIENPDDDAVYVTVSPSSEEEYTAIDEISCEFERNIVAGSAGSESDGVARLLKCNVSYDDVPHEELALFISGSIDYMIRCGYPTSSADVYRPVCNTIVGTARYVPTAP